MKRQLITWTTNWGTRYTIPTERKFQRTFVHLVPGAEVKASLLRKGRWGIVTQLSDEAADIGIPIGAQITAGPRSEDERLWTFLLPDGSSVRLNHHQADAVTVRLEQSPQPADQPADSEGH